MPVPAALFFDFDGTITRRDVTDVLLEVFADRAWLDVEQAWLSGRIGSRECLAAQMALVAASPPQLDQLLDSIEIDRGFMDVVDVADTFGVPVYIVSDGFDYCIRRILARAGGNLLSRVGDAHVVASSLELEAPPGRWRTTFRHPMEPCAHGCATCKPLAMERLAAGRATIFVGDGMSDRYAAAAADVVFAKGALAAFCVESSIVFTPFETLDTIAGELDRLMRGGLPQLLSERVPQRA